MKFKIGYFYSNLLNLYGDNGNVEILCYRAASRGFDVEVVELNPTDILTTDLMQSLNFIFMGGGPDSGQKDMYGDLLNNKGTFIRDYVERGGVGLYICGSYQLMGKYYKAADESVLEGTGIFNLYTENFGIKRPRCIGNIVSTLSSVITSSTVFSKLPMALGATLVGFENHGGRTYLEGKSQPFAYVQKGYGNNGEDRTEGVVYKNSIGTYLHGPILARNPHFADYLIAKSLGIDKLEALEDDTIIVSAHTASLNLKQ